MDSELPFPLPEKAPGMTLPDFVLFPHATVTFYIFEPRYRKMLAHVLQRDHLILIATKDPGRLDVDSYHAPYYPSATLGRIESNKKNSDGSSTIVVHGLARVTAETTFQEDPFRIFSIRPQPSTSSATFPEIDKDMNHLLALIQRRSELGDPLPSELLRAFSRINDPETLADLAAFSLVSSTATKLKLLESLLLSRRYDILFDYFRREIRDIELMRTLQGGLRNDYIRWN
tara:strand:- start:1797 stop:2486 length:690 start_codon:yes stop_codon:yes gene_type:complete